MEKCVSLSDGANGGTHGQEPLLITCSTCAHTNICLAMTSFITDPIFLRCVEVLIPPLERVIPLQRDD